MYKLNNKLLSFSYIFVVKSNA